MSQVSFRSQMEASQSNFRRQVVLIDIDRGDNIDDYPAKFLWDKIHYLTGVAATSR